MSDNYEKVDKFEKVLNGEYSCVYLIKEREFIKTNEDILKVGYSNKLNLARYKTYPNNSLLLFHVYTENGKTCETDILECFKKEFIHRKDIGNEYFQGNYKLMRKIIMNIVEKNENKFDMNICDHCNGIGIINYDSIGIYHSFLDICISCNKFNDECICDKLIKQIQNINKKYNNITDIYNVPNITNKLNNKINKTKPKPKPKPEKTYLCNICKTKSTNKICPTCKCIRCKKVKTNNICEKCYYYICRKNKNKHAIV